MYLLDKMYFLDSCTQVYVHICAHMGNVTIRVAVSAVHTPLPMLAVSITAMKHSTTAPPLAADEAMDVATDVALMASCADCTVLLLLLWCLLTKHTS